ncbi:DUF945 family protein [uncultured Thiodictyon sp.]|uniref:DUF945 family protein n=1 Tax=uncultured Thiodictyon sp. TaxID=1846217 RepID=UPI0025CF0F91|nr:DUF945 family protein [uncultured Thiodictyon sp.]
MKPLRPSAKGVLIALGLIVVLLSAALPGALGAGAQRAYQSLLRSAVDSLSPGWVLVEHYDRGWFSSHASAELTRHTTDARVLFPAINHLRLDSRIDQGPWSWFSGGLRNGPFPAVARVQTRVEWLDAPLTLPPLILTTGVGANGAGRTHLLIPATDQTPGAAQPADASRLHGQAITGAADFTLNPRHALIELHIPELALDNPDGSAARLTDARLTAELTDWIGGPFSGHATLDIATARLRAEPQAGTPPNETVLDRLALTLDQVPKGAAPTLRLDLRLKATAEQLRLGGSDYRAPVVGLSAQSLDAQTLTEMFFGLRLLLADTTTPDMRGMIGITLLAQVLPRFLAAGPNIGINPFTTSSPDGPVAGHLSIAAAGRDGPTTGTAALLGALLGGNPAAALTGEGELALPRPTAVNWLAGTGAIPASAAEDQLKAWIDGGWVTARDGRVTSALRLAQGRLTINGKRMPMPFSPGR